MNSWPPPIEGFRCVDFKRKAQASLQRASAEFDPAEEVVRINRSAALGPFRTIVARRKRRAAERSGEVA